ncbi:unnamed protein product [Brassica oleracea var. botrytis]|uniref:Uncharacterized protein n=2 Tax=Brassica TaxID=3705 RepID=A0A3P6DSF7_BRAOL|nr:unnamed protein product [Brassica napus]CDY60420.1 BnaCnng36240D [Brassica napus]VDD26701.1 unnamed protein product [Brassica oleracea]
MWALWYLRMRPKVEPRILNAVSTRDFIRVFPFFFSRRELTDEARVRLRSPFRYT